MKKLLTSLFVATALVAVAGTRSYESSGSVPSVLADGGHGSVGVALNDSAGCRFSARTQDGGTLNGGTIAAYYYDSTLGWVRSNTQLDCTLEASKLLDGGAPSVQVCPDLEVLGRFGRVVGVAKSMVAADGGAAAVTIRTECWGSSIP